MVQVLKGPTCFPAGYALSVLSYNVLLPNSQDGWWTYKMYSPPLDEQHKDVASWEYRRDLIKDRISAVGRCMDYQRADRPMSHANETGYLTYTLSAHHGDSVYAFRSQHCMLPGSVARIF